VTAHYYVADRQKSAVAEFPKQFVWMGIMWEKYWRAIILALLFTDRGATAQQSCRSTILVTVYDDSTLKPVEGLTAADFHGSFKARELTISAVSGPPSERRIVFVFDRSGSIIAPNQSVHLQSGKQRNMGEMLLQDALTAIPNNSMVAFLAFSGRDSEQTGFLFPSSVPQKLAEMSEWKKPDDKQKIGKTPLWDSIDAALHMFSSHRQGDVMVVVSDGFDNFSRLREKDVRNDLIESGVELFAFLVRDPYTYGDRTDLGYRQFIGTGGACWRNFPVL
jgi:hypothetical protein